MLNNILGAAKRNVKNLKIFALSNIEKGATTEMEAQQDGGEVVGGGNT